MRKEIVKTKAGESYTMRTLFPNALLTFILCQTEFHKTYLPESIYNSKNIGFCCQMCISGDL